MVHGKQPGLDYRQPVGTPRLLQVVNIGLTVLAAACVPAAASVPAVPAHLSVATALVLRLEDIEGGATTSIDSALTAADAADVLGVPGLTGDLFVRNRFENGYVRAFAWRDASLVITKAMASTTYLFADPAGAHTALSLVGDAADAAGVGRMSLGAALGDESTGFQIDSDQSDAFGASIPMTTTGILFRHANAVSLVSYRAPSDEDDPSYVIGLARRQLDMQKAIAPLGVALPLAVPATRADSSGTTHSFAKGLVLTVSDLPAGMRVRNEGSMSAQEFASGDADMATMLVANGFLSAYGRAFARRSQFGKDATVIRSETAILVDSGSAHEALASYSDLARAVGARNLGTTGTGDESRAFRIDDYAADASYVEIVFRHRNALSLIEVQFPARMISRSLSLDLANKQVLYQLADLGMLKPFH